MSKIEIYDGKQKIAKLLLDIGAVTFSPNELFTWASGIKSPIYCDNRLVLSSPVARSEVASAFTDFVRQQFPAVEGISGTATAGIPHAALLADRLGLPMTYVRSSAKSHGKQNQVEGRIGVGQRLLVVEDTISTGASVLGAVEALRAQGAFVDHVISIFTYGFANSEQSFERAGVTLLTLTDYPSLLQEAVSNARIQQTEAKSLEKFYLDPWSFGKN